MGTQSTFAVQNRESRTARFQNLEAWNRLNFHSERRKNESKCSEVELWKFDSESLIRIATYQFFKLSSPCPLNRAIQIARFWNTWFLIWGRRLSAVLGSERTAETSFFFCSNFLNTPMVSVIANLVPRTSWGQRFVFSGFRREGTNLRGKDELLIPAWKTPTPPGSLRTKKVNFSWNKNLRLLLERNSLPNEFAADLGKVCLPGKPISISLELLFCTRRPAIT